MRYLDAVEYQGFWGSFWDLIWWFLMAFVFVSYLFALFAVIADLFRDHKLSGWAKALWFIFLIVFPILSVLIYLIVRGRGMAQRSAAEAKELRSAQDEYIRSVAGASPSEEIAKAKTLLDSGVITQDEFDHIKSRALS
ncbi:MULTISPECIES: SHOCT domain-containing protein [unclassified Microbacterium]|uniref:SHOCT domain-containing protein n=1 Tax=unclassified Microbacterium TaxID=2609290 RepID=UPI00214CF094|nr:MULTISPECIES: SHOCT domain-containing protein [unclassified Microbacterium]MCR2809781.1 SHOCT domain-containing protein [Microbacterium sp. zg.B185]WIM17908.1 SHOCT domain-containing protein [Microbacterium sp. zg-B185]